MRGIIVNFLTENFQEYLREELMDGNLAFYEGLLAPPTLNTFKDYCDYFDDSIHEETPMMFGLHANAQITYRTTRARKLFKTVTAMRPCQSIPSTGMSLQDHVKLIIDDINEELPMELLGTVHVLNCIVLYCIALYCIVLCFTLRHCVLLCCVVLCCADYYYSHVFQMFPMLKSACRRKDHMRQCSYKNVKE